jgi:putative FmdB family regulatory protein
MPLYEYKCGSCGVVFEVLQRFSDEPLTVHAGCGGTVERLVSTSALQFKGTGWYVTDYARKSNGGSEKSGNSKPAAETKPAAKTESSPAESKPAASKTDTKNG